MHVCVREGGDRAPATEVDPLGCRQRPLVRADAAHDLLAGDCESAAGRQ